MNRAFPFAEVEPGEEHLRMLAAHQAAVMSLNGTTNTSTIDHINH